MKRKYKARKKKEGALKESEGSKPSFAEKAGPSSAKLAQSPPGRPVLKSGLPKKPKKGMATPKQRLGKILGIHKLSKF